MKTIALEPPYDGEMSGLLRFANLSEAEKTLARLENLRQRFMSASDKKGVEYCLQVARLGRQRAEMVSRNRRVRTGKRLQKQEIALWFRVWLETPDLFCDWLQLRKTTAAYQELCRLVAE